MEASRRNWANKIGAARSNVSLACSIFIFMDAWREHISKETSRLARIAPCKSNIDKEKKANVLVYFHDKLCLLPRILYCCFFFTFFSVKCRKMQFNWPRQFLCSPLLPHTLLFTIQTNYEYGRKTVALFVDCSQCLVKWMSENKNNISVIFL